LRIKYFVAATKTPFSAPSRPICQRVSASRGHCADMSFTVRWLLLFVTACLLASCSAQSGVNTSFYLDVNCTAPCDNCTISNPIITAGGCVRERSNVDSSSITTACNATHVIGALIRMTRSKAFAHHARCGPLASNFPPHLRSFKPSSLNVAKSHSMYSPHHQVQATTHPTAAALPFPLPMKLAPAVTSLQATPPCQTLFTRVPCAPRSPPLCR
jgi:hypothetical protein